MLRLARSARALGMTFDEFWDRAVRPHRPPITMKKPVEDRPPDAVAWPRDSRDRDFWISATNAAKEGWRRAYDGEPPTTAEIALAMLGPDLRISPERAKELAAARGIDVEATLRSAA
jgi:hypothetical protein